MTLAYDIEVFPNLFTVCFKNVDTGEETEFVVCEKRNDLRSLLVFLSSLKKLEATLVGFNNIGYDYPVIEPILSNWRHFWNRYENDPLGFCDFLFKRSKDVIETEDDEWFLKYYYFEHIIKQVDLYRIYHLNNKHKRSTSLKWVEFVIGHDLLQTFDFDPLDNIDNYDEVLKYNLNDVRATYKFYHYALKKINYRKEFGELEGLDFLNLSDTSIAKKLFAKYLTDSMGISYPELKEMRTKTSKVALKDVILDIVEFETDIFQSLLELFKNTIYDVNSDVPFHPLVEHCGLHFDYGVGGLHAYPKKWVIGRNGDRLKDPVSITQDDKSDDDYQIIHVDVSSYYPNIAINNKFKPTHLGDAFVDIYSNFYERRKKAKYEGNKLVNEAMKLSLNSVFGLTKEKHSFFYDLKFQLSITINGQLLLTMLAEQFCLANIKLLQCNTDGIYVKVHKSQYDELVKLCDWWCDLTGLQLDLEKYQRLCQRDVNNYIGLKQNGDIVRKGAFRIFKEIHEDASMKIVPMALGEYLLFDTDYREYIKSVKDIDPFMMGLRIKRADWVEERFLGSDGFSVDKIVHKKALRYIVSRNGNALYKVFGRSGLDQKVQSGFKCKIANDLSKVSRQDVDERFYIAEVEKIASLFNRQQLSLSLF